MTDTDYEFNTQEDTPEDAPAWTAIDPCPNCGARPHDAPEGVHAVTGDPFWVHEHCFKCGYRPGGAGVVANETKQFELFQRWQEQQRKAQGVTDHPTMNAPPPEQVAAMQDRIRQLEADLAERNKPNTNPTSNQATFGGGSV